MIPAVIPAPDRGHVLSKATIRASQFLGLNQGQVEDVIGVSPPTISRIFNDEKSIDPASKAGQLALLLIRIYRSLDVMVGADDSARKAWMKSRNNALGGIPMDLIKQPEGLVKTLDYLDGMRAPT